MKTPHHQFAPSNCQENPLICTYISLQAPGQYFSPHCHMPQCSKVFLEFQPGEDRIMSTVHSGQIIEPVSLHFELILGLSPTNLVLPTPGGINLSLAHTARRYLLTPDT